MRACQSCGSDILEGARFCPQCGSAVQPLPDAPVADRQTRSVLAMAAAESRRPVEITQPAVTDDHWSVPSCDGPRRLALRRTAPVRVPRVLPEAHSPSGELLTTLLDDAPRPVRSRRGLFSLGGAR